MKDNEDPKFTSPYSFENMKPMSLFEVERFGMEWIGENDVLRDLKTCKPIINKTNNLDTLYGYLG